MADSVDEDNENLEKGVEQPTDDQNVNFFWGSGKKERNVGNSCILHFYTYS